MDITAVDVFEEIRFIVELLAAELIFLIPFVPMKKHFVPKLVVLILGYMLASLFYFPLLAFTSICPLRTAFILGWYIIFALSTLHFCKRLFFIGTVDGLYVIASAYAVQHLVYVVVHEALALYYWTYLKTHLIVYIFVC